MKSINWLVAMDHADIAFLNDPAELSSKAEIDRQSSLQANKVHAGVAKLLLQVSATSGYESQVQTVCWRVSTEVEFHGLSAATVQRIQNMQDFDQAQDIFGQT